MTFAQVHKKLVVEKKTEKISLELFYAHTRLFVRSFVRLLELKGQTQKRPWERNRCCNKTNGYFFKTGKYLSFCLFLFHLSVSLPLCWLLFLILFFIFSMFLFHSLSLFHCMCVYISLHIFVSLSVSVSLFILKQLSFKETLLLLLVN